MKKVLILILAVILSLSVFAMAACQQPCETHVDGNHDGICDVCEETGLSVTHTDSNHDGKCDGCGATTTFEHVDAAHDGKCDVCNQDVEVIHVDADGDGFCDVTACGHKYEWVDALADAKEYVDGLYLRGDEITAVDFEITTVVSIGGVKYNVAWEIQSAVEGQTAVALGEIDADTLQQKVNVDEFSAQEVAYKLVATVSDAEGHSVKVEYARKVPQFVVSSYEDYLAHCKAADGVSFTIRAYVIGAVSVTSSSKGSLYLQDADGNGYYAYAPSLPADATASEEALDAYFPFGTEVCVTGTGTVYGGQYEFNKGCQIVKTGNVATAEQLPFENVTEAWGSAKNQGDHDALMQYQNKLVVLEEAIFTKADDKYYYFTVNGVQYNIYKTNYFMADQADIDALFAKFEVGKAATIKGIVSCYSNLYQIYPLDVECISNVHTPELSDAEKVAFELGNLQLPETITEAGAIQLPAVGSTYETVSITWALKETYACATIADGKLNVTLPSEATTITVVATLTLNGETETKEVEITVASSFAMSEVHAYVGYVNQVTAGKQLYLDGGVSGRYLTTTTDASKAVSVYAEKVDGGYKLYILVDGTKQYITIYANSEGKDSVNYDANGTTVYAYNPVVNAFTTNFNGKDKYLGTYNSFETISVSNLSYINAENTGVSQFPLEILPVADGASYSASVTQVKLEGKVLYLDGGVSGRYLTTTEDLSKAVVIYAEKVDGGYKFYKLNGTTKEYITIYANSEGKDSVNYDAAGNTVFNYDPVVNAWTTFFAGKDKYLGTYNTFNTISVSNLSYITAENTGVSQFPLVLAPYVAGVVPPVEEHKCESVCPTCGKCLDEDCAEAVCAEKCKGHTPAHTCESKCPTCGKCLDEDCAEAVCADKCEGHAPVVAETTYTLEVPAKGASWTEDTLINDIFYVSNKVKTESVKIDGATCDGLTFSSQFSLTAGKVQVADGVWSNSIFFTVPAGQQAKVVLYAAQKADKTTSLKVMNAAGETIAVANLLIDGASADAFNTLPTTAVSKYEFTLAEGTYHIGGAGGGAYVYGMKVTLSAAQAEEPAAVVINGQNYSEAQAEEALLALKAGDVVVINTNGTIAKEYTFVAANYTIGEGAQLAINANAVAPAGAKLAVSAGSKIVVGAGATIDLSALTQADFSTSTEARLVIAADAKVIMPAYTEQLWNDKYLNAVIVAMVADSEVGAQLVLGETTLTKTANGWEAEAPANTLTIEEAIALGKSQSHNTYTTDWYYVTGVITNVYNTQYGNMYIRDDKGNTLTIYGTYSADGSVSYKDMTTKPVAGDTVTIYGAVGQYSNTPQIKNGWIVEHVIHEECTEWTEATCTEAAQCTVCGKVKGEALGHTEANAEGKCDRCGVDIQAAATQVTVTAKYTGTSTTNMKANTNNAALIGLDANLFNVVSTMTGGNTHVGLNKNGSIRLYGTKQSTLTISIAEGYQIVSIKVIFSADTASKLVVNDGTTDLTGVDNVYTVNGSEVVLYAAASGQVRMTGIEIVYAPVA